MYKDMMTLDDVAFGGKTVLCRVDFGVAGEEGADKLAASLPTIRELSAGGAKTVLLAHQGAEAKDSLLGGNRPLAEPLSAALGQPVRFVEDICGPAALEAIGSLAEGEVLLLDNLRFLTEESTVFERNIRISQSMLADTLLVRRLAPLADLFVNDCFSTVHLRHPSVCGFPQRLPAVAGRLLERELAALAGLMEQPARPCLFVLGGKKLGEALQIAGTVLEGGVADQVLLGGLVSLVFLWIEGYEIGEPSKQLIRGRGGDQILSAADRLMDRFHDRIVLPTDYGYSKDGRRREAMLHVLHKDALITDIGTGTAELFRRILMEAGTVFVNGTMGVYEKPESELGTRQVWKSLAEISAHVILGGDDTAAATKRFGGAGLMPALSTGGDALISYLVGNELPGVSMIQKKA